MATDRDTFLDAARGTGILLVLCGHLLEPSFIGEGTITLGLSFDIWRAIYSFHMPFFFLISGMIDDISGRKHLTNERAAALQLVLTALTFSTLAYLPQVVAGSVTVLEVLLCQLVGGTLGLAPLWFLIVLAWVRSVYAFASKTSSAEHFWLCIIFVTAMSWACAIIDYKPWYVQSLFGALPFYVLGRLYDRDKSKVSSIAGLTGLLTLIICSSRNMVHLAAGEYGDLTLFAAGAFGGCCFVIAFVSRIRGVFLSVLAYLGLRSFELFIVSGIILAASPRMRQLDNVTGIIIIMALGVPSQIALAWILRRPILAIRRMVEGAIGVWARPPAATAHA